VQVINSGCIDTSAFYLLTGVGIGHLAFDKPVRIYPNPAPGAFWVELGRVYPDVSVQIHDLNGREVFARLLQEGDRIRIDLGDTPAGIYLIRISAENRQSVCKVVNQ
jgi:hypothetical protein